MFGFFKKKKKEELSSEMEVQKTQLKSIDYEPKIILAWAKAVEGDKQFQDWLRENGYEELFMATYAIYLNDKARAWLVDNGYAHLMAFINASEGIANAQKWLKAHKFDLLYYMALAIEDEDGSWEWLNRNATQDIFILTQSIKKIKDEIEFNHNEIHSFGKDL